jgi:tetratricopeptide (TPR) repeat protein
MYEVCLAKRKQNCFNEAFVDVLVNSAVCLRQLGKIGKAIERMMSAIEISKDLQSTKIILDDYHLFLAKLHFENADFRQAYKNYLLTYKMRKKI